MDLGKLTKTFQTTAVTSWQNSQVEYIAWAQPFYRATYVISVVSVLVFIWAIKIYVEGETAETLLGIGLVGFIGAWLYRFITRTGISTEITLKGLEEVKKIYSAP